MSGINDVLKGDGCVLKKWVCRSQPRFVLCVVCVCVCLYFLIVFCLHCRITSDGALLFCPCALKRKWCENCEVIFHEIAPGALRPDRMNSKLHRVLPSLASTKPVSAQHRDSVCSVRWQPGLKHQRHSWMISQYDLFPSVIPHFFSASPLFLTVCLCLHWKKETYVPVQRETH